MRAKRRFGKGRRPGISNLVGAIFFVLIVALALSVLAAMFTGSSGFIGGIHTTNYQADQAVNANVGVSSVAFGGELAKGTDSIPVNPSSPVPLLPITSMNFTGGIQGWYVSRTYPNLVDGATVTNALQSNGSYYIEGTTLVSTQSLNSEAFLLTVSNGALPGSGDFVDKISVLVDTYFNGIVTSGVACQSGCAGWNAPMVSGNNITLSVKPVVGGIPPGFTSTWIWTADVPQAAGVYYDTVAIYWWHNVLPVPLYLDYGIATVSTIITSPLPLPNPQAPGMVIAPRSPGISPGGLIAGYDSNALSTTVSSGPGSAYVTFEPDFSGAQLPAGQQLSAGAQLTTTFPLTLAQICQLRVAPAPVGCGQVCPSNCFMSASLSSSLDEVASVPNSLVYYHLVLVNPSGVPFVINTGGTDPTVINHFGPTGWVPIVAQANTTSLGTTATDLQDSVGTWVPGQWVGDTLTYTSGPAAGQSLVISSNTANTVSTFPLSFSPAPTPGGGDTFLIRGSMHFAPPSSFWVVPLGASVGIYKLELVVNMTMPSGLPSQVQMHFDDIGLALNLVTPFGAGSSYGSGTFTMTLPGPAPSARGFDNVQDLSLGVNVSLSSDPQQSLTNTAAYVYAASLPVTVLNEPSTMTWVEVGSATFNGSSDFNVVIPSAQATAFVNAQGQIQIKVVTVQVGGGAACLGPSTCTLAVSAYAVAQWENSLVSPGQAVFTITNGEGSQAIHLVSLSISGNNGTFPSGPLVGNTKGVALFAINNWVSAGDTIVLFTNLSTERFAWVPGQVYQVTLLTAQGVSYSASFTAP